LLGKTWNRLPHQLKYEAVVRQAKVSSELKNFLMGLRTRLTEKSQDEIADAILSGLKQYGPTAVLVVLRLAAMHHTAL